MIYEIQCYCCYGKWTSRIYFSQQQLMKTISWNWLCYFSKSDRDVDCPTLDVVFNRKKYNQAPLVQEQKNVAYQTWVLKKLAYVKQKIHIPQPKAMANMLSTGFALPNTKEDRRPSPQRLKKEQFWELPEHALQMDTLSLTFCISNIVYDEGTHYPRFPYFDRWEQLNPWNYVPWSC